MTGSPSPNNPPPEVMRACTLRIMSEYEESSSPGLYGSIGSPDSQCSSGYNSSVASLQHRPVCTVAETSHMMGLPTHSRSILPMQSSPTMDMCSTLSSTSLNHSSVRMAMQQCPDMSAQVGTFDAPYLTPPREVASWGCDDLSDFDFDEFGDILALSSQASPLNDSLNEFVASSSMGAQGMPSMPPLSHSSMPQLAQSGFMSSSPMGFNNTPNVSPVDDYSYFGSAQQNQPRSQELSISPMQVLQQAQAISQPRGQQWMAPTPGSYHPAAGLPHMHKDMFTGKTFNKADLPIVALWEFLLEALYYPCYEHILKWKNKAEGDFKIVNSSALAKLWGVYKRKKDMNFDKMSRAMRYYYDKGILQKGSSGARLEYKFGLRSNWMEFRPPHGSVEGRFFHSQPPRRTRGSRAIAPDNTKPSESKPAPCSPVSVSTPVSVPLSHPPLPSVNHQTFPQHGHHAFNKPAASASLHRFSPY